VPTRKGGKTVAAFVRTIRITAAQQHITIIKIQGDKIETTQ
jgi:hypothetical protein